MDSLDSQPFAPEGGAPAAPAAPKRKRAGRLAKPDASTPAALVDEPPTPTPPPPAARETFGMCDPGAIAEEENLWWVNGRGETYLIRGKDKKWLEWNRGNLASYLRSRGLEHRSRDGSLSEVERVLLYLRSHRVLDAALPGLAGYHSGVYEFAAGKSVLIRTSPVIIEPKASAKGWPLIARFLNGLFGPSALMYFLAWLKLSYEALRNETRDRGQILVIAGPAGSGKGRVQHNIITPILGGRNADPCSYLFGEDRFNSDLSAAEHLLLEDPAGVIKAEVRAHFKERIKSLAVNDSFRVAAKFADATTLSPFWRLSITLNDDPEAFKLMPQLTPDIRDKIILLKAWPGAIPMPTVTAAERSAFREAILEEIPALLADLVSEDFWASCPHVRGGRFGSLHYADPELAGRLSEGAPSEMLLEMVDAVIFDPVGGLMREHGAAWEGKADELESTLTGDSSPVAPSARRLLNRHDCARLLSRLAEDHPARIQRCRDENRRWWGIMPPPSSSVPKPA